MFSNIKDVDAALHRRHSAPPRMDSFVNNRVLIVDDQASIHDDFAKLLADNNQQALDELSYDIFEDRTDIPAAKRPAYQLQFASQGKEGLALVEKAESIGKPFAMAFVDMRMPPGWDGLETIERIWQCNPNIQIVICSAYSDYGWQETIERLGTTDRLLILRKPFDAIEVRQMAAALTQKWSLNQQASLQLEHVTTLVNQRTKQLDLAKQQLETALKEAQAAKAAAESATKAKSQFLATMSHEIRTPLNGVLGLTEVLLEEKLSQEQHDILRTVSRSAATLLTLISDILDFSKVEAGKLSIDPVPCNVRQLLDEVYRLFRIDFAKKKVVLEMNVADDIPEFLRLDPVRVRQIIVNLIGNALKFTPSGFVRINASGKQNSADTLRLLITVTDTGIGIEPTKISELFEEFKQADSSTSRQYGGSGLGLAISKRLVSLMHGDIGACSDKAGSTFWFSIPVETECAPVSSLPPLKSPALFNASVLVAEDNPINQLVARKMLEQLGCKVTLVASGPEALKALEKSAFDIVFMDCQMPDLDGYETTRRLRSTPNTRNQSLPVIALTADVLGDQQSFLQAGMNDMLYKPVSLNGFRTTLNKWLPSKSEIS